MQICSYDKYTVHIANHCFIPTESQYRQLIASNLPNFIRLHFPLY